MSFLTPPSLKGKGMGVRSPCGWHRDLGSERRWHSTTARSARGSHPSGTVVARPQSDNCAIHVLLFASTPLAFRLSSSALSPGERGDMAEEAPAQRIYDPRTIVAAGSRTAPTRTGRIDIQTAHTGLLSSPSLKGSGAGLGLLAQDNTMLPGFTLIEIAVVLFLMGLMFLIAMPYIGGISNSELKSASRRLAGPRDVSLRRSIGAQTGDPAGLRHGQKRLLRDDRRPLRAAAGIFSRPFALGCARLSARHACASAMSRWKGSARSRAERYPPSSIRRVMSMRR